MLDPKDLKILEKIQDDFPLVSRPFERLAADLGLDEAEVISRLKRLKKEGILRHFGASIDSRRLGFVTTLCAVAAPPAERETIARKIARYPEVTHCYLRKHHLNVWFTLVAKDFEAVEGLLSRIASETGLKPQHFPAQRMFKLKAVFKLKGKPDDGDKNRNKR